MKNFIRQLLRENPQLADKIYFNSGKLSPRVKEIIFKITNGDPFTKLITDIYFYMLMEGHSNGNWALSQLDPNHQATEKPENDVMDIEQWRKLKSIYNELKEYNKNVFPISGFNINGVENIGYFLSALKQRTSILNIMKTWPSIALRNMKADIRQERTYPELQDYRSDLEHFDGLYSQLSNRNEDAKRKIENKMFRSNITLEDLIDFAEEKENLLGGEELTRKQIGQIIKQEQQENDELRVRYSKDNIMIIEVTGPQGIKKIGCNSVWCFTYNRHGGSTNWNDWNKNSTDGFAYIIVDFNEPSSSPNFMYVLTKPLMYDYSDVGSEGDDRLYDMSNHNVEEPNEQISRLLDFETAKKVMNFGFKQPKEKQKKQKFVDPAQYSLELSEGKSFIKQLLREGLDNNIIRLYHRIADKKGLGVSNLIKDVFQNGLIPHDNGEVGSVIWFSPNYDDYAKNGEFVVAYDYDKSKSYDENNQISYFGTPFGNEQIPFDKLIVIKVPIMKLPNGYLTSEDLIRLINVSKFTPERINQINAQEGKVTIFNDLFNMYVQPNINYPNFLEGINHSKIKFINIW